MPDREPSAMPADGSVVENPWSQLRRYTTARIGLGRAGVSQPTRHHLAFQMAHARARDAVHSMLDTAALQRGVVELGIDLVVVSSEAPDRQTYLLRPDLGRRLAEESALQLRSLSAERQRSDDIALVIADGLSATAVQQHALPVLDIVIPSLVDRAWTIAPLTIVTQGRVAIADEIGALLGAKLSVILIGERPGLSAHDSMGIYMTFDPRVGRTDAERNCISNVRDAGLSYKQAASTLLDLVEEARRRKTSGVSLKREATAERPLN